MWKINLTAIFTFLITPGVSSPILFVLRKIYKNICLLRQHIKGKHEKQKLFEKCPLCEKITSNMKYHLKTNHYDEYIKLYPSEDPSLPTPILGRTMIQTGTEENFEKVEFANSSS